MKSSISKNKARRYYVYLLKCADGTFYTGIATNVKRREAEHNSKKKGAKYTKARQPVLVVYSERRNSRSAALKREYAIKQLTRKEKLELIG